MSDIKDLTKKLLDDAAKIKCCRNCKMVYIRPEQEWGYCKLHHLGRPVENPLVVHEYNVCPKWKSKIPKKKE